MGAIPGARVQPRRATQSHSEIVFWGQQSPPGRPSRRAGRCRAPRQEPQAHGTVALGRAFSRVPMLILVRAGRPPAAARHRRLTSRAKTRRHRDRSQARDQLQAGMALRCRMAWVLPAATARAAAAVASTNITAWAGIGPDAGRMCQHAGEWVRLVRRRGTPTLVCRPGMRPVPGRRGHPGWRGRAKPMSRPGSSGEICPCAGSPCCLNVLTCNASKMF